MINQIPTSGTTGEKKICLVSDEALEARALSILAHYGKENMVAHPIHSFYNHKKVFILDACQRYGSLTQDITEAVIIVFIQKSVVEFSFLQLEEIKKATKCKYFVCGGMNIGEENWQVLQDTLPHAKILSQYGMAEAGAICITDGRKVTDGLVGKPYPGVEVKVENEYVFVKSKGLMSGYENQEPISDWFNTGDKGYFDNEGNLHLYGNRT